MNLHDYIRVVRRRWWLLALLTILGALGGAVLAAMTTPSYQVTATIYVSSVGTGTTGDRQQGNVFAMQRVGTYAQLATTGAVLSRAAEQLDDGTTADDLQVSIAAAVRSDSTLIDIFGSGSDPERLANWVNEVAQALSIEIDRLEAPTVAPNTNDAIPVESAPVVADVVDAAVVPTVAISPQPRYNLMVGAVVGLALGVAVVVTTHALDTRIHTMADLPRNVPLATRTALPARRRWPLVQRRPGERLEPFRTLRGNLLYGSGVVDSIAVAAVDSAADGGNVAEHLAAALGEIGGSVVIVETNLHPADPRRQERRFAGDPADVPGVADLLRGSAAVRDVGVDSGASGVVVIPPGAVDSLSPQLLSTSRMKALLTELKNQYDHVILSCPPLVEHSESAVVAALADTTLVVVQAGSTRRASFLFAIELLTGVRAPSISVVLDNVQDPDVSVRGPRAASPAPR